MKRQKLLYLVWLMALLAVLITAQNGQKEATLFEGIAETRELMINSEKSVEIQSIHVVPGQEVQKGDILVELRRPELALKLNAISHELEEIKSQELVNRDTLKSQLRQLRVQKTTLLTEIDHKIKQLESQYHFNKEMLSGLKSIPKTLPSDQKPCAMNIEIENLKQERYLTAKRFQTQMDDLNSRLLSSETPETIHQERLQKELALLECEKQSLLIHASINGVIGALYAKAGEKVSPFQAILTLHTKSPSFVRGYIHEQIHNQAAAGDKVRVIGLADGGKSIEGDIVGVGSRIIEYPQRLKKRPAIQIWGREVEIRLPENNPFLLGEKVMIQTGHPIETPLLSSIKKWFQPERFIAYIFDLSASLATPGLPLAHAKE